MIANLSYRIDLKKSPHRLIGELMYFPSGVAVKALSMGFYAPLADLIWLRFIQYYGEHRMTDAKFELMYHILDILTTLNPYFIHAYTLGALMLTHDAKNPEQSKILLKKGIHSNIKNWRLYFVYGFIHYVFLHKYQTAHRYFKIASTLPEATDMPKRWAAFTLYKKIGDLKSSLALWIDLYNNCKNPEEKNIAEIYIKNIKMKLDLEFLNKKIEEFKNIYHFYPPTIKHLLTYNIIDSIPSEPHGCKYYIKNGKAFSSWQR